MNRSECVAGRFTRIGWSFGVVLLAAVASQLACRPATEISVPEPTPVLVRTLTIPVGASRENRSYPIFAKEGRTAKLSFRVPGELVEFTPILGTTVLKDEVIARLDPRDYRLAVARIDEGLVEANAALSAMRSGARAEDVAAIESQLAGAETAVVSTKKQLDRMENLLADGTAPEVQYDLAKTTHDGAVAQRNTLLTQLEKAKTGARAEEIEAMEAKIAGLRVERELAENRLADTELKSPFDGLIARKFADNHENIGPGIAVLELVDSSAMEGTLHVPEEILLRRNDIEKIVCRFPSFATTEFVATIKEIGPTVQSGNLAYPLTVRIESPIEGLHLSGVAGGRLLPGMAGTAELTLTTPQRRFVLPPAALVAGENDSSTESAVWLIDNGGLVRRAVTLASFTPEGAVVESGLIGGEKIVAAGARFLQENQKVRTEDN